MFIRKGKSQRRNVHGTFVDFDICHRTVTYFFGHKFKNFISERVRASAEMCVGHLLISTFAIERCNCINCSA